VTGGNERIRHFLSDVKTDFNYDGDLARFIALLHAAKTKHYVKLLESNAIALRPSVIGLINETRSRGLRLAIATITTPENVTVLVTNTLGEADLACETISGKTISGSLVTVDDLIPLQRTGIK